MNVMVSFMSNGGADSLSQRLTDSDAPGVIWAISTSVEQGCSGVVVGQRIEKFNLPQLVGEVARNKWCDKSG